MTLLSYQPFKAIWVLLAVALNIAQLPLWLLYFYSFRPHPKWTLRQAIGVHVCKRFLYHASSVHMKTPYLLLPGAEKERWSVIEPPANRYFVGRTKADPGIVPVRTGGTWYPQPLNGTSAPGYVGLHFHGGAFVIGDGRVKDAGHAAKQIIKNTEATHVFAPQYRLSSNPNGHFPAALQDAISAYLYLLHDQRVPANKIVVSGDSAGGNLVMALLRYLHDHGESLGVELPVCAWLWSPWIAPVRSLTAEHLHSSPNYKTDLIPSQFGKWGAETLRPRALTGLTLEDPYITFSGNAFASKVPLWISAGECEVLLHDITRLVDEFKDIPGNTVHLSIEEYACHDVILIGKLVGFEAEAARSATRAGEFLRSLTRKSKL